MAAVEPPDSEAGAAGPTAYRHEHEIDSEHDSLETIPEVRVARVGELLDAAAALLAETNLKWWFRGHANASWELVPSGQRGYSPTEERYMANDFMVRARIRYPNHPKEDDYAGWVSLMQHMAYRHDSLAGADRLW